MASVSLIKIAADGSEELARDLLLYKPCVWSVPAARHSIPPLSMDLVARSKQSPLDDDEDVGRVCHILPRIVVFALSYGPESPANFPGHVDHGTIASLSEWEQTGACERSISPTPECSRCFYRRCYSFPALEERRIQLHQTRCVDSFRHL